MFFDVSIELCAAPKNGRGSVGGLRVKGDQTKSEGVQSLTSVRAESGCCTSLRLLITESVNRGHNKNSPSGFRTDFGSKAMCARGREGEK